MQVYFEQMKHDFPDKPVMYMMNSAETHDPFYGADELDVYEDYTLWSGISGSGKFNATFDSYATLLKYTDHTYGSIIEFLKQKYNNTIVVITGDHGTRFVPEYQKEQRVNPHDPESVTIRGECVSHPYVNDLEFDVSGVIAYLGDKDYVKEYFNEIGGKTFKFACDHQDLVRTVEKLVEGLTRKRLPSAIQGQDLFQLARNATQGKPLDQHISFRTTTVHTEVFDGGDLYRFHTFGNQEGIVIRDALHPTCIKESPEVIEKSFPKDQYNAFKKMRNMIDQLNRDNRFFHYGFRDESCQYPSKCEFPARYRPKNPSYGAIYIFVLLACVVLIDLIIVGITWAVSCCRGRGKEAPRAQRQYVVGIV